MSAPTRRCRTAGRDLTRQPVEAVDMSEFPPSINPSVRPGVFISYSRGDRLCRGFEAMLAGQVAPSPVAHKPHHPPPDGLKTTAQAAAKLGCSIKTLNAHVAAGDLRYVTIGKGTKRPRKMFTDADLNEFITNQTRKDVPCPSTRTETAARRTSISISKSKVIGFMEARNRRRDAKPKR